MLAGLAATVEEQPVRAPIDSSSSVLVVGASRGLGLEFASKCLKRGATVYATHREPEELPPALAAAAAPWDAAERLHAVRLDVGDDSSIAAAVATIQQLAGTDDPLTHVVHNAGIYGPTEPRGQVRRQSLMTTFEANAVGPLLIAQAVAPLLKRPVKSPVPPRTLPVYALMSSKMGSVEDNTSGGSYAYRMSKAALNICAKSLWHDLQGRAAVVLLHPGYVRTDMTGGSGLIDTDESVSGLLRAIEATGADTPFRWVDYKANLIPF
mmetsp:Transcript_3701/g.9614  ORF Transcript_3701/g.9614 Transcript_3701/m.9614 type:complete len:266 (+) Transcript_3701:22-819(+)